MKIVEKAACDDFADAFRLLYIAHIGLHECTHGMVALRNKLGPFFTEETDPQSEEELCKATPLAVRDGSDEILCALFPHTLDLFDIFLLQGIEIRGIIHEMVGDQAVHNGWSHAVDIHRITRSKVNELLTDDTAAFGIHAAESRFSLDAADRAAADRTCRRHVEGHLRAVSLLLQDLGDLRNDFSGLVDENVVSLTDVFLPDEVQIVQRRTLHGRPRKMHRRKVSRWCQHACPPHRDDDLLYARLGFFRRIFISHRPLRIFDGRSQRTLLAEIIHLDDHAVGIIAQVMSLYFPLIHPFDDSFDGAPFPIVRIHVKVEIGKLLQQFLLAFDLHAFDVPKRIGKKGQIP